MMGDVVQSGDGSARGSVALGVMVDAHGDADPESTGASEEGTREMAMVHGAAENPIRIG